MGDQPKGKPGWREKWREKRRDRAGRRANVDHRKVLESKRGNNDDVARWGAGGGGG